MISPRHPACLPVLLAPLILLASAGSASAEVAVVNNRTEAPIAVATLPNAGRGKSLNLPPGQSQAIFFSGKLRIRIEQGPIQQEHYLTGGQAYVVVPTEDRDRLGFRRLRIGSQQAPVAIPKAIQSDLPATITVKLLLDEDEPTKRSLWEPRLRQRVALASDVFLQYAGVRLEVVAVERWESDDQTRDFEKTLKEFETEVDPAPAQIAIGFSSQYRVERGRFHLGGTRGTLHSHILIKERAPNVLETERCELLVHELGHCLAAAHSPEPYSVMRPLLRGGQQRRVGATIKFDPTNALLMGLMADEMRRRPIQSLNDLTPATRRRMSDIYRHMQAKLPQDPAAKHYRKLVARASLGSLAGDVRTISQRIVEVAQREAEAEERPGVASGDMLLERYVREAALAAQQVRPEHRRQALLLALGLTLDDTGLLRRMPTTRRLAGVLDDDQQMLRRLQVLGTPTMQGRHDLARHFFVSAHLTALAGSQAASGAGLVKELFDADGGSGFSFADLAANRAGIAFAAALLGGRISLDDVAKEFSVEAYLPPVADLAEGLSQGEFATQFGSVADARYRQQIRQIDQKILALPVYRPRD